MSFNSSGAIAAPIISQLYVRKSLGQTKPRVYSAGEMVWVDQDDRILKGVRGMSTVELENDPRGGCVGFPVAAQTTLSDSHFKQTGGYVAIPITVCGHGEIQGVVKGHIAAGAPVFLTKRNGVIELSGQPSGPSGGLCGYAIHEEHASRTAGTQVNVAISVMPCRYQ